MKHRLPLLVAVCALLMAAPQRAAALYLDPGTGSMVLQIAIGSLLAALAAVKMYWNRISSLFGGKKEVDGAAAAKPKSAGTGRA